jgi:hypothetical protein
MGGGGQTRARHGYPHLVQYKGPLNDILIENEIENSNKINFKLQKSKFFQIMQRHIGLTF